MIDSLFRQSRGFARLFRLSMAGGMVLIVLTLKFWAAGEVREETGEIIPLAFLGAAWLLVSRALFPWLGISIRAEEVPPQSSLTAIFL